MNRMEYDDSEKLGDAYEYLLKIAEAQADAGQFRTPRHIINFIVNIINPQKHEVVIDPACGTAGFLVSAYQHVKNQHRLPSGGTTLSTPDLTRLADNLKGYDISPEMTKLAMANMYLHTQNKSPNIANYDTLTSTDHWNEYADVLLANPPFMTPKGGIKPHARFRVLAKKAEVLFVDYIASHLNEHGRAGIIVPEGIIFQSQNAYKQLRRLLLDESLVAVISLPSGVFNPYSGVKTSILILDKVLAPKTDHVAFFKVGNDGYDLGSQRRPITRDDLPAVTGEVNEYLRRLRASESLDHYQPTLGYVVAKSKIVDGGNYNLNGERYNRNAKITTQYPLVKLGEAGLFEIVSGGTPKSDIPEYWEGGVPWITLADLPTEDFISVIETTERTITDAGLAHSAAKIIPANSVVVSSRATIGRVGINRIPLATNQGFKNIVIEDASRVMPEYVALAVTRLVPEMQAEASGATYKEITKTKFAELEIPLPPLEVQRELVDEIEAYQRVIDGSRMVVDSWRPRFAVDPEWPVAGIEDLVADLPHSFKAGPFGSSLKKDCYVPAGYKVYGQEQVIRGDAKFGDYYIEQEKYRELESCKVQAGDVLVSLVGTYGKTMIVPDDHEPGIINPRLVKITLDRRKMIPEFFTHLLTQDHTVAQMRSMSHGGTMDILNMQILKRLRVPVPPVGTQQVIVSEIEAERALVSSNRDLAERMEQRIQDTIARVWEG